VKLCLTFFEKNDQRSMRLFATYNRAAKAILQSVIEGLPLLS